MVLLPEISPESAQKLIHFATFYYKKYGIFYAFIIDIRLPSRYSRAQFKGA